MLQHKLQLDLEPRNSGGRSQVAAPSVSAEGRPALAHSSGAPAPTVRPEMGEKAGREGGFVWRWGEGGYC